MKNETLIKNERGLSIVELLVSIGIMSIVGAAMTSMMSNQALSVNGLESRMAALGVNKEISDIVLSKTLCTNAIGTSNNLNPNPSAESPISFRLTDGTQLQANTTLAQHDGIRVDKLVLKSPVAAGVDGSGNRLFVAQIETQFSATRQVLGPKSFRPQVASSVSVSVNAGNRILDCGPSMSAFDLETICESLGGVFNPKNLKCNLNSGGGGGGGPGETCSSDFCSMTCATKSGIIRRNPNYNPARCR